MARCLIGLFVLTVGLVALTSTAKENRSSIQQPTVSSGGPRLRETEAFAASGASRTLLLPAPVFGASFSLN
jgi:hypothetical protein